MVGPSARTALLALALCLAGAGADAGQKALPPLRRGTVEPAKIDKNGVLILVRSALLALDQANQTGNYTVLRDLGTADFQRSNTAARLGDIFQPLRTQNLDLSGVAVLDPQLTLLPQIEANGQMHMTGFFPSVPLEIKFDLVYAAVNGRWRLNGISVSMGSAAPGPGN